jgi:hypothetical protein
VSGLGAPLLVARFSFLGLGLVVVCWLLAGCGGASSPTNADRKAAINAARAVYADAKGSGTDLSKGPCLAEKLGGLPDWVVDVAHDPRRKVDDNPANQCARYVSGAAHHFVELDPNGKLIRAQ